MIMRESSDPRLQAMISITRVKVSPDLSVADIYVSVMASEGKKTAALNALKHSAGLMRSKLSRSLSLRQTPYLKFHFDERLQKELQTLDLLETIRRENEELDKSRVEAQSQSATQTQAGNDSMEQE